MKTRNCAECGKVVVIPDNVDCPVYCNMKCYQEQYPEIACRRKYPEKIENDVVIERDVDFVV